MKYCIPFNTDSKYLKSIDELVINFRPGISELRLQSFIDMHTDQRVTLDLESTPPTEELKKAIINLRNKENFSLRFKKDNAAALECISDLDIKWYFTDPAMTYDDIYVYKTLGASEFFIGAQLGFDLPHCKAIAQSLKMQIRSIYAYAVEKSPFYKNYWQYFIRPEDIPLYDVYLDTVEFYGEPHIVNLLVKTYKAEKWNGPLNEIIPIIDKTYDSRFIIPHWGRRRISCNRKCMYGDSCTMCETIYNLSQSLEKARIIIPPEIRGAKAEQIIIDEISLEESEPEIKPNF